MSVKEIKLIQNCCVLWSHVLVVLEIDRPAEEMAKKAILAERGMRQTLPAVDAFSEWVAEHQ